MAKNRPSELRKRADDVAGAVPVPVTVSIWSRGGSADAESRTA